MGKLNNGILGGFSGKVGPVVGSSWNGIPVMRSRPPRKRHKSTTMQLAQMAKMTLMTGFVRPLSGFLNQTYRSVTVKMSCYNKALSYNMRNAIDGEYPAWKINYARVALGIGDLLQLNSISSESVSEGKLLFSWADNSGEGSARASDLFFAAAYCPALEQWKTCVNVAKRPAGSYTLDVTAFSGKAVEPYIGFLSEDGKFVSASQYTGTTVIL